MSFVCAYVPALASVFVCLGEIGAESAVKRDLNTIVLDEWNCCRERRNERTSVRVARADS